MTDVLYVVSILALIQGLVALRDGRRNMRYALGYPRSAVGTEAVLVLCPVKGSTPDLEANARSLLGQDHPNYRVVFLVDSDRDPAFQVLDRIAGAQVQAVGLSTTSGQKIHALIQGANACYDTDRVFVFCDADAQFPRNWLGDLVSPLADSDVGATTGYRWYVPEPGNPGSFMRSAWNATIAGVLGPHRRNFLWGGSMAIRRELFDQIGVIEHWRGALSDDYALTAAVQRAARRIVYVPTCLVPSYGGCRWRDLFEFTTRQIRITRVYAPDVWRLGLVSTTVFNLAFVWLTLAVPGRWGLAGFWLGLYLLAAIRSDARIRAAARSIGHPSVWRHRWFYRLSPPLVSLLFQVNFLASLLSRTIVWKGVEYTLVSARETRVNRPGPA